MHGTINRPARLLTILAATVALGSLAAGCGSPAGTQAVKSAGSSSAPASTTPAAPATTAAPSPTIQPINRVAFVITGNVSASQFGEVDITYGSDSSTHDVTLPSLAGKVKYVVPFDSSAQYYSVDVTFDSTGNVSCRIVALGPAPDNPLTVSHGSASGGNSGSDCSAQAAPNDSTGESWQNEQ